jgi:tetrahydromethanopterin S-methyltransferase subunit E
VVYCVKCGFKNKDDAYYCVKCGSSLPLTKNRNYRSDNECFGISEWGNFCFGIRHGGAVLGVVFGVLIILAGVSALLGQSIWHLLWPLFVIAIGLLIVIGAIVGRGWRR